MSPKKSKMRKISPSDDELESEIAGIFAAEEVDSIAKPIGVYTIFNRIKTEKTDWMLSPMRVTRRLEAMVKNGTLLKVTEDDCKYFLGPKTGK
jgi:hypothetical protein